jgi:hypothetical protein
MKNQASEGLSACSCAPLIENWQCDITPFEITCVPSINQSLSRGCVVIEIQHATAVKPQTLHIIHKLSFQVVHRASHTTRAVHCLSHRPNWYGGESLLSLSSPRTVPRCFSPSTCIEGFTWSSESHAQVHAHIMLHGHDPRQPTNLLPDLVK